MKFLPFLISPFFSLYSPSFYKQKLSEPLKFGFLYLSYLAAAGAFTFLFVFQMRVSPILDEFVDWIAGEMPEVVLNQGKVTSIVTQPYRMNHPKFGSVLILDSGKESLKPDEIGEAMIYITKTLIYVHNPIRRDTQTIDLAELYEDARKKAKMPEPEVINGESILKMYGWVKPVLIIALLFGSFFYIWMWKLGAAFLYSVVAIIFSRIRGKKFPYPALLNVTIYAMTAVSALQLLGLLTQNARLYVQSWIAFGITVAYLGLVFFVALPPEEIKEEPGNFNAAD